MRRIEDLTRDELLSIVLYENDEIENFTYDILSYNEDGVTKSTVISVGDFFYNITAIQSRWGYWSLHRCARVKPEQYIATRYVEVKDE